MRTLGCLLILVFGVAFAQSLMGAATAQSPEQSLERFKLFNDCEPMYPLVENLPADAAGIGLSKQSIQAAVESRLRAARLYDPSPLAPYLYVNVNVFSLAFNIKLEYYKMVIDLASGLRYMTITWGSGVTGVHGGDASYILSGVSELMDQFLLEYLRVNEEAC